MNSPRRTIDLNADLGEGFPNDEALLERVTSASVSCGAHAGDRETILATLRAAKQRGVVVGAHPGFADRENFGRREMVPPAAEVERLILDQFARLATLAAEVGSVLAFVKPHGALYNQAQRDHNTAEGVVNAILDLRLPLLGQPHSVIETMAQQRGVRFIAEGFPDRRYQPDGRLAPRSEPGAVLVDDDEVEAQAVWLAEQGIATLCIHGDDPHAVANADHVRSVLARQGFLVKSFV